MYVRVLHMAHRICVFLSWAVALKVLIWGLMYLGPLIRGPAGLFLLGSLIRLYICSGLDYEIILHDQS